MLTKAVTILSAVLIVFSMLGCAAAWSPPQKRCSRWLYISTLLILFLALFSATALVLNVGNSLEIAKEHHSDVHHEANKATTKTLHFLHGQLGDYYKDEGCSGGSANGTVAPLSFEAVTCQSHKATEVFKIIFPTSIVVQNLELDRYRNCTADTEYTPADGQASNFTQAFCGAEAHVASLAQKYSKYLACGPAVLAGLVLLLLVATICLIPSQRERRQAQLSAQHGPEVLLVSSGRDPLVTQQGP